MLTRVKGTQDFLDMKLLNFLTDTVKKHLHCYHFHEITTPILEQTELFKRSVGEATDIVSKEMYTIPTSQDDQESICLRPEATASTMRAFLEAHIATTPWKTFLIGPMFRKERPQKGRFRQFHQINMEIIGTASIAQDAYFITMLDRLFAEKLQLKQYGLLLNFMGCPADREAFNKALGVFLNEHISQMCQTCLQRKEKNMLRVFDCKNPACQELYKQAPHISDSLCTACAEEWKQLQSLLGQLSVSFSHAPQLVRGLDYYSKTVFEFVSLDLGAQNSFCGGGRYNKLATALEAKEDYPSIGAAIGVERMLLILEQMQTLALPEPTPLHVIIPCTTEQIALGLQVADELHAHQLCAEILVEGDSLKSMMRQANKLGAKTCIIIGQDEQAQGQVTIKQMANGTETKVAQRDIVEFLKS